MAERAGASESMEPQGTSNIDGSSQGSSKRGARDNKLIGGYSAPLILSGLRSRAHTLSQPARR